MREIPELKDRHIYRLQSRNLDCGVFTNSTRGFMGIREKLGRRFPSPRAWPQPKLSRSWVSCQVTSR